MNSILKLILVLILMSLHTESYDIWDSIETIKHLTAKEMGRDEICNIFVRTTPDAFVILDNRTVDIFFNKFFWSLHFDESTNKFIALNENATEISDVWPNLPNDLDYGFTVQRTNTLNPIAGHTIFVKNSKYFMFKNRDHNKSGSTMYWGDQWKGWKYIITLRNSSLVLLSSGSGHTSKGEAFYFDDIDFPENLQGYWIVSKNKIPWNTLQLLVPLPYGQRYFALSSRGKRHQAFYCVLQDLNSECDLKPIHEFIGNCSEYALKKYWVYWVWNTLHLNMTELFSIISGASFAVLFINCLLLIISFNIYKEIT